MAISKEKKQRIIEDLEEKIARQKIIIFTDFTGLKVKDFFVLRKKAKTTDSELKVVKKTLTGLVFEKLKLPFDIKKLKGEIALLLGYKEEISPAKIIYQFSKENQNLKILGGILENQFVAAEKIIELAKLSGREELLAKVVGSISAPISGFINVLQGNIKGLIYVLSVIKK